MSDPAVEERIRSMCEKYLALNAKCCVDDKEMERFKANMHDVLNNEVGMKIPKDVHISLDYTTKRWATLYVRTEDGENVAIHEDYLGALVVRNIKTESNTDSTERKVKIEPFNKIRVNIHDKLSNGAKAVLRLPFFDVTSDPMIEIKFQDDAEIILSSC